MHATRHVRPRSRSPPPVSHVVPSRLAAYSRRVAASTAQTDRQTDTGASTPYKRWSKCTMEKVGGAFLQKLRGSALTINALPP